MWQLDHKGSWVSKNWCFWTVVLKKTLESPLDCKEVQPVHPKGDQFWVFIGRTDVEAETSMLATGRENISFIPIPKKGNAKESSNYHTIAIISHTSKVMLKILQFFNSTWTVNFQLLKPDLEKAEEPEIKLPTSSGSSKKQDFQRNTYFCFIDYVKAFLCVDHSKLWKILQEMGIPDHLTCLLTNLYAGLEATVRTGHWTIE